MQQLASDNNFHLNLNLFHEKRAQAEITNILEECGKFPKFVNKDFINKLTDAVVVPLL